MLRKLLPSCLTGVLLIWAANASAQGFEGVIRQRVVMIPPEGLTAALDFAVEPPNFERILVQPIDELIRRAGGTNPLTAPQVFQITWHVNGRRARMDLDMTESMPGTPGMMPSVNLIVDEQAGTATALIPQLRAFTVLPLSDVTQLQAMTGADQLTAQLQSQPAPTIRALGGAELRGHPAEGQQVRFGDTMIGRIWTSATYPANLLPSAWHGLQVPIPGITPSRLPVLVQSLARTTSALSGQPGPFSYTVVEVLAIEPGTVADDLFRIPQDYQRMAIPGFQ